MEISTTPYKLKFRYPFQLATGSRTHTDIVIVKITDQGGVGYGEASLPPYLPENTESVKRFIASVDVERLQSLDNLPEKRVYIDGIQTGNTAAKAALDIALHDLTGKSMQKTVGEMYGIERQPVFSTFTIGISSETELREKLKVAKPFRIIKLKLGSANDRELVERFRKYSDKPFCVDVNQGWTDKAYALSMAGLLADLGALFIEQPMPKAAANDTAWLRDNSKIPIIADEAVQRISDLENVAKSYSGINIKLMKSTGLGEAVDMISRAREMGLKVVVGCMAESSCAVTAAAHLAPLADWADLDGPLLIDNDPFRGIRFEKGEVIMPGGFGTGSEFIN